MINPEKLLDLAGTAFLLRPVPSPSVYALICLEGNLLCVKRKNVVDARTIIATFSNASLEAGLNTEQWNLLRLKITAFFKDAKQCPKVQKP